MDAKTLTKSAWLMLAIVALALISWELRLRKIGVTATYDGGDAMWANKRDMVYAPKDKSTVFIGSSRIRFDLDIQTWETITGNKAVQLACDGSNPIPILNDLANDTAFKGKLIIDVTEGLFFSLSPFNNVDPEKFMKYYKDLTLAKRASFQINKVLESNLVFLDKEYFSLNAYLNEINLYKRGKVFVMPVWPWQFGRVLFSNQQFMNAEFLADTNLQRKVTDIWSMFAKMNTKPPVSGKPLDSILQVVKNAVNKIKVRGGEVLFIRTPSSGPYLIGEEMGFPREKYWDRLLAFTQCAGIHFQDYPLISQFQCPEWSHLAPTQAIVYTKELIRVLQEEKGWEL